MIEAENILEEEAEISYWAVNKARAYERAGYRCEAPEGCEQNDLQSLTIDHFTPKCIAKVFGWTYEMINHYENLQVLCRLHHQHKDATTLKKLSDAYSFIHRGREFRLGDHH